MAAQPAGDLDALIGALDEKGCGPDPRRHRSRCPAHEDRNPSLGFGVKPDGWVWVKCHAGCSRAEILEALGLTWKDLAPPIDAAPELPPFRPRLVPDTPEPIDAGPGASDTPPGEWTPCGPAVASYVYTDEQGEPLYTVCRTADKQFPAWRPEPAARYGRRWNLNGTRRVLYRLPDVIAARDRGDTIWLVEGEKDVHALVKAGATATCNPGGVGGGWRTEYTETLQGAVVVIVADRDKPGRDHAAAVARALDGTAKSVTVVEAAAGKDAADHLAAGHTLDDFTPVDLTPPQPPRLRLLTIPELRQLPPPTYLIDKMLVEGTLANLFGESGAYKSFVALDWALSVASGRAWHNHDVQRGVAVYVAAEGVAGMSKRIDAWERANHDHNPERDFRVIGQAIDLLNPESVEDLHHALHDQLDTAPKMLVIDTLARSIPGADENSAQDMGRAIEHLDRIRRDFNSHILLVHHSGLEKGRERGSTALRGAMDSRFEVARAGERIVITCKKQKDDIEHEPIEMTAHPCAESLILAPVEKVDMQTAAIQRVEAALREHFPQGTTKTKLANAVGGRRADALAAIDAAALDLRSPVTVDYSTHHPTYFLTTHRKEAL